MAGKYHYPIILDFPGIEKLKYQGLEHMKPNKKPEMFSETLHASAFEGKLKGVQKKCILSFSYSNDMYFLVEIIFNIFTEYILHI